VVQLFCLEKLEDMRELMIEWKCMTECVRLAAARDVRIGWVMLNDGKFEHSITVNKQKN
jgi:hypothetical protein